MKTTFDFIVIGSGPGGYSAAIRAAQLGYTTAIVEKYSALGGTCTNVGCIPSKALLDSTEHYHTAQTKFEDMGIHTGQLSLDTNQLFARKDSVVAQNAKGIRYLMDKNKIEVFEGMGAFLNDTTLQVINAETTHQLTARYFIIATGSKPASLPEITIDKKRIISSTEALSLGQKPNKMTIIGGGVIGVEMASIFSRMGTKVTIIEYADELLPSMDRELGKTLKRSLKKQGVNVLVSHKVQTVKSYVNTVTVSYLDNKGKEQEQTADYCLVAVGRKPYTEGLGLENTTVQQDEKGRILTNEKLQTHASNIYAIGDVIQGAMLAHKAEEEGIFVVETIHGQQPQIHYDRIPGVVYSWPEVASVGKTEEELKAEGKDYNIGKFPFSASGRARAAGENEGFAKVLTDAKYGEILGVHIFGPRAADLIAQAVTAIKLEATDQFLTAISYAHPTYSEALKEAYWEASGKGSINL
ncbi:MAG: dihydrolipoyl dehydrogenase [Crocinitomicaceae bacterium]|nr:dihydrolipoyl dehydrogenase [Crocinitomicaceae bacterium]|tara:strand:- start:6878 stop:8281 length:1404 start_codon:yes stop_codon:yes gene_type:complete